MSYAADGIETFNTPLLSCYFVIGPRGGGEFSTGVYIGCGGALAATWFVASCVYQAESVATQIVYNDGYDASTWSVSGM